MHACNFPRQREFLAFLDPTCLMGASFCRLLLRGLAAETSDPCSLGDLSTSSRREEQEASARRDSLATQRPSVRYFLGCEVEVRLIGALNAFHTGALWCRSGWSQWFSQGQLNF